MLENEIKIYKADAEQSIEAKMTELAEVDVIYQSKSASADIKSTQMAEQTSLLRKIFKFSKIFYFLINFRIIWK